MFKVLKFFFPGKEICTCNVETLLLKLNIYEYYFINMLKCGVMIILDNNVKLFSKIKGFKLLVRIISFNSFTKKDYRST